MADGSDLEARSQMLMASHLSGVGQASGTGVGLVHALGHAIGTRGRLPHGTALATILPEVLRFYSGTRDAELAMVAVALRVANATDPVDVAANAATAAIDAVDRLCAGIGQRSTLRSFGFDDAALDIVAHDALDDAAIANSPRLPTLPEARTILAAALG